MPSYDKSFHPHTEIVRNITQSVFPVVYTILHWFIFILKSSSPFFPSVYSILNIVFHFALIQIELFCTDLLLYSEIIVINGKKPTDIRKCSGNGAQESP